ncbi:hypothetical protein CSUI_004351 [Cystoisospora suis]|uniref:Secreted protein n=1 Tax=Cystoisospora suis TaxID=483139 RepID=A0A2C6L1C5_9APIC|nr:hypothetical protein CSUI_004351 [Cystoisospora suis]
MSSSWLRNAFSFSFHFSSLISSFLLTLCCLSSCPTVCAVESGGEGRPLARYYLSLFSLSESHASSSAYGSLLSFS